MSKTVEIFMYNDTLDGPSVATIYGWGGKVINVPRSFIEDVRDQIDGYPGVYICYSPSFVYVGESLNVYKRLLDHFKDGIAEQWDRCIIIVDQSNFFNKARICYIESKLIELHASVDDVDISNKIIHPNSLLSRGEQCACDDYLRNIVQLTSVLGYDGLSQGKRINNMSHVVSMIEDSAENIDSVFLSIPPEYRFILISQGVDNTQKLLHATPQKIMALQGIGQKGYAQICKLLDKHELALGTNSNSYTVYDWIDCIQTWLDELPTSTNRVCVAMIWIQVLNGEIKKPNRKTSNEIHSIMQSYIKGWRLYSGSADHKAVCGDYGKQICYERVK